MASEEVKNKINNQLKEAIEIISRNQLDTLIIIGRSDKEKFHCIIGSAQDLTETIVVGRDRDAYLNTLIEASNEVKRIISEMKDNN